MKKRFRLMPALHLFVGIGAITGGLAAILDPVHPMGMPVEALRGSPFGDYLIPGIVLFALLGIGNVAAALLFFVKYRYRVYFSGFLGCALAVWIAVQCLMLRAIAFPHVLFFAIGVLQAALAAMLLFSQRLFPADIILRLCKGTRKK